MPNRAKLEHSWCCLCLYHTKPRNLQINRAESCNLVIGRPSSESCAFGYWQNAKDPEAPPQLFLLPITFVRLLSGEPMYGTTRKFIYVPMERPSISATRWACSEVIDLSSKKARKQESKKARKQESKKARKQESKKARKQESKSSKWI